MFKISHEVPIELLGRSLKFNDYDYALVHLFDKYAEYFSFYKQSVEAGRMVILDNSAYELGEPYESEGYKSWINSLKPTEYILPDYRDNSGKNLEVIRKWECYHRAVKIGVIHGEDYTAFCQNYRDIKPYVDKIAISFETFFFEIGRKLNLPLDKVRQLVIKSMLEDGVIDTSLPHHILGALSPTEYKEYVEYDWIVSADTSNPVLHGLLGQRYEGEKGLLEKSKVKMDSLIDKMIPSIREEDIMFNVRWFREQFKETEQRIRVYSPEESDFPEELLKLAKKREYDDVKADHYRKFPIETIELMKRIWGDEIIAQWCEITAFKYRMRLGHKPTSTVEKDILKERWYLDKAEELKK